MRHYNVQYSHQYCHLLTVSTTQAKIVWTEIIRHNINICCIKPAQICILSHIGRNLGVLLFNHVKYKLFLRQTLLTDCQIHNSDRMVWSVLWIDGMLNGDKRMPPTHTGSQCSLHRSSLNTQYTTQLARQQNAEVYSNRRLGQTACS